MKPVPHQVLAVAAAFGVAVGASADAAAVDAAAAQQLARQSNCLKCHAVDRKKEGPAYKDVAAKYKGDATAVAKLTEKVKKGGSGVWGPVPMPPNAQVSDADAKKMVELILALKK